MKLRFTLFAFLSVLTIQLQAQIINLLSENFNNGFPAGWVSFDGDGLTPNGAVAYCGNAFTTHDDYDSLNVGDSILVATSWFNPAGQANNFLFLPQLTLQANGNFLVFEAKSKDPSFAEAIQIVVATAADTASIIDTLYIDTFLSPVMTQYSVDLDSFAGQTIYLAVQQNSIDDFILCLDNFRVYADLQNGIHEVNMELPEVKLFPNPVNDLLQVNCEKEMRSLAVFDLSGRMILNPSYASSFTRTTVDVSELPSGIYLLEVQSGNMLIRRKFVRS